MPQRVIIATADNIEQLSTSPAGNGTKVLTLDVPFGFIARGLYVGVAGNITLVLPNGTTCLLTNVPVGVLPISCIQVNTSGTAASGLVALA
jgi:hypothetical protein